jgi:hypothetical protein
VTVVVPEPIPLEMPPGDAEAMREVVQDVAGAAFHLTVLSGELAGPAASAPGWLGDDAAAAATQVAATATLARSSQAAVLTAMHRLSAHCDRLDEARRRIAALEREQDDDFAAAWGRLSRIENPQLAQMTDAPELVGVVEDLRASEDSRRRRHAAVLEDVADDAAATARVLADCCAPVGGRGARGDDGRVVAYMAARLPGWGDGELAARGRDLAHSLMHDPVGGTSMEESVRRAAAYAAEPPFATAFVGALGVDGIETLLLALGRNDFGPSSPVARVLAAGLGAAAPAAGPHDPIRAVLTHVYVGSEGHVGEADVAAAGMAALLTAATPGGRGGLRLETVAEWGRQLLRRERAQGVFAGAGAVPADWAPDAFDPAALVIDVLAAGGDQRAAAALLADEESWDVLLSRRWADDGASFAAVVALAGAEVGPVGAASVVAGLRALAGGLDDGDSTDRTVNDGTAARMALPLAMGLSAHTEVLIDSLSEAAADGTVGSETGDVLRGLSFLTLDRAAAERVQKVLTAWTLQQQAAETALPAVAVPAAYLAVREYGQRLPHALRAFAEQESANDRKWLWDSGTAPLQLIQKTVGRVVGLVEPFAAKLLGADGSWDAGEDEGLVFDRGDAVAAAVAQARSSGRADPATIGEAAREARTAFDRTARVLGSMKTPTPVDHSWTETGRDAVAGEALEISKDRADTREQVLRGLAKARLGGR